MKKCILCESSKNKKIILWKERSLVKCNKCGLYYVVYRTKKDFINFYNKVYDKNSNFAKVNESKKIIFLKILKKINYLKGNLLDVGCADGYFLFIAKKFGWKSYGVEISNALSQKAKEQYKIEVVNSTLVKAGFKDNYFDAITLIDVIDQLENPVEDLREIIRILKQGGVVVLRLRNSLYHVNFQIFLKKIFGNFVKNMFVIHEYSFAASKIKKMLAKIKFVEIKINNSPFTRESSYSQFKLSKIFVSYFKTMLYYIIQVIYFVSFKKLFLSPSLIVYAKKY